MDDAVHQYDDSTSLPLRTAIFHDKSGQRKITVFGSSSSSSSSSSSNSFFILGDNRLKLTIYIARNDNNLH